MGKKNNVWNHYFRDKKRFADLFNGVYFHGRLVIQAEELTEISEIYAEPEANTLEEKENDGKPGKKRDRLERFRDILMTLKTGETFRLLAVENQQLVNYAMPFRCMQYDTMEYSRQLDTLRKKNEKTDDYATDAERIGKIKKIDRLTPVYTLCLYHGEEPWDGPRSLKDMMNFGKDSDGMSSYFADYPLNLYCLNEQTSFDAFQTEIKKVFQLMGFRRNKVRLQQEIINNPEYHKIDIDSLEVVSVMLDAPQIWKDRAKYIQTENEKEECDMCQAIREWIEEERSIGMELGKAEGKIEGETLLATLMSRLFSDNRTEDARLAVSDENVRKQFYREYGLI